MGSGWSSRRRRDKVNPQLEGREADPDPGRTRNRPRNEMEIPATSLQSELERKDQEIAKLTRTTKDAVARYENLLARMNKKPHHNEGQTDQNLYQEEIHSLKDKIMELNALVNAKQDHIENLGVRLKKLTREKNNQVGVVKDTVEKVIDDKDAEIRRLKALWGVEPEPISLGEAMRTRARFGISAETRTSMSLQERGKAIPKTDVEKQNITRALYKNLFMSSLAQSQVFELIECMKKEKLRAHCTIIREGEAGTHLYVIQEGEVEVFQGKEKQTLAILPPGCVFGELAILYNCKRTASVRAHSDVVLWSLDRSNFQSIVQRRGKMIRREYAELLKSVSKLRHLPDEKIMRIADCLEKESFAAGEHIIRQGEAGDTFYIIYKGEVKVTKYRSLDKTKEAEFLSKLGRGKYFGERALLREEKRAANVIADSDVVCLTLDRLAFISLIGEITEVNLTPSTPGDQTRVKANEAKAKHQTVGEEKEYSSDDNAGKTTPKTRESTVIRSIPLDKLQVTKLLGKGGFGTVRLAQIAKLPGKYFALKSMRKSFIVKNCQEMHVIAEKNTLMSMNCSFIARLHRTYKDKTSIYMLMDAYLGGDVYGQLKASGPFAEAEARFCIACVVEALAYLRFRYVAYRDLKPENLMLDRNGYIKLVDFGFAKKVLPGNKTWTFCGTPEYFPPEILQNLGHDSSADYWSLGILVFELLTMSTPFFAPDDRSVYEKILEGIERIRFPAVVSKNAELLIRNLCRLDPKNRLGSMSGGVDDIRKHRWFRGFYWEGLRGQKVESPINVQPWDPEENCDAVAADEGFDGPDEEFAGDTSAWDLHF